MFYEIYLPNRIRTNGRKAKRMQQAFGKDDFGIAVLPKKLSNVKVSRINNFDLMGGCPFCFPHGIECINSKFSNQNRSWKRYRRTQWKYKTGQKPVLYFIHLIDPQTNQPIILGSLKRGIKQTL
jgi:hypothetical protein